MPNRYYRALPVRDGRFLRPGDRRATVLGADFAAARRVAPGARLALEGTPYTVVGVLERMLTAPDRFAIVGIDDARELLLAKEPMLGRLAIPRDDLNTGAAVGWREGTDPDELARRIATLVADVNVTLPSELSDVLRSSTAFFSALLVGIAALGLTIGGLSLSNTVAAAVFERLRDFGIKRALGATDLQLGREVLSEALSVTLIGGIAGIALAAVIGFLVNTHVGARGQYLFLFSSRLVVGAALFSLVLGAAAAAYATVRVVRLSPAEAIRRGT
jgi:putative ABC transport system permease protein